MLETLDDIVRFSACGLLIWLAVLALRDFRDRVAGRLGALSAVASAAYLLSTKIKAQIFGAEIDLILLPLHVGSIGFAWLFCLSQFDDRFEVKAWHVNVIVLKILSGAGSYLSFKYGWYALFQPFVVVTVLLVSAIVLHLLYEVWQGRNEDLVEERRQFRTKFVVAVVVISLGVMIAEIFLVGRGIKNELLLTQSIAFLCIAVYPLWRLSSPGGEDLFFRAPNPVGQSENMDRRGLAPTDQHDLDVIKGLAGTPQMLESGLTISRLSDDLHIPEHRLRHLINQNLGYRNFSDFLNHHRIERAKEQLSDESKRNTPVLTLAMELGYGSLGPFNRAFKERTGLTPTEFRTQSLEASLAAAK